MEKTGETNGGGIVCQLFGQKLVKTSTKDGKKLIIIVDFFFKNMAQRDLTIC